jgi:hypothetical protein
VTKETSFDDVVTCPVRVVDEELVQAEVPEQEIGPHFRWKYCETFYDRNLRVIALRALTLAGISILA